MATQTTTETSTTTAAQPTRSRGAIAEEHIAANINWALNQNPGGSPGGNPGGNLGGNLPGGGPPGGGLPVPQQVVIPVGDVRPMGALPFIFTRNRTQVEAFLAAVWTYLNLNFNIPGFNSPMKKVALTLLLMQGLDVELWVNNMGRMLEQLDLTIDNVPALWDQFLEEFREHFANTHKVDKA
jgi:hypothetical protein